MADLRRCCRTCVWWMRRRQDWGVGVCQYTPVGNIDLVTRGSQGQDCRHWMSVPRIEKWTPDTFAPGVLKCPNQ